MPSLTTNVLIFLYHFQPPSTAPLCLLSHAAAPLREDVPVCSGSRWERGLCVGRTSLQMWECVLPEAHISWALITQPRVLLCFQVENGDTLLNPHHHFSSPQLTRCSCIHRGEALEKWQRWLIRRLLTNATGQIPHQFPSLCLTRRSVSWTTPHEAGSWTWPLDVKPG